MSGHRNVAIFRTSRDNSKDREWLAAEFRSGRLRQGWGGPDTSLIDTNGVRAFEEWAGPYMKWIGHGPEAARKRWSLLKQMTWLQKGDIVLVPNWPEDRRFASAIVSDGYQFALSADRPDDFGHIIHVDPDSVREHRQDESLSHREVWNRLRKLRSCFGFVRHGSIDSALESILEGRQEADSPAVHVVDQLRSRLAQEIQEKVSRLSPHEVEKLVGRVFENAGFAYVRSNFYDRRGGDADLVMDMPIPLLTEATGSRMTIYVQVKQRRGQAKNDIDGVRQVADIAREDPFAMRVLVSTADDFDQECCDEAATSGVYLISGPQLAEVLAKYL